MDMSYKRADYIDNELAIHKEMGEKALRIQQKYDDLVFEDEKAVSELIMLLDEYSSFIVKRKLGSSAYYSKENIEDVLQNAREDVFKLIMQEKKQGIERIANYVCGIYYRKTADFFRALSKHEHSSLDEEMRDDDREMNEVIPGESPKEPWIDEERSRLFKGLLRCTCRAIMESKEYPPYSLAVIYAQVISHIDDSIPAYKKSSAKWAYNAMGEKTVGFLGKESEDTVQKNITGKSVFWGEVFYDQLDRSPKEECGVNKLREVIFTQVYTQGNVDKFISNYQKGMFARIQKLYKEDNDLLELSSAHLVDRDYVHIVLNNGGKG